MKGFAFPLAALLFVAEASCPKGWLVKTKLDLAEQWLKRFSGSAKRLIVLVDNRYAKGKLAFDLSLVSRLSPLRSTAAFYELPQPDKKVKPGRARLSAEKISANKLERRRTKPS